MKKVHMNICPNVDSFHKTPLFVIDVNYGEGKLSEPSRKAVEKILKNRQDETIVVNFLVCSYCWKRGVKGISHFSEDELREKLTS